MNKGGKQKKRDNFTFSKFRLSGCNACTAWKGEYIQISITQPFVKRPPSLKRKLIKLPEFASHIYWNHVTSTELAWVHPPPRSSPQKKSEKGATFSEGREQLYTGYTERIPLSSTRSNTPRLFTLVEFVLQRKNSTQKCSRWTGIEKRIRKQRKNVRERKIRPIYSGICSIFQRICGG